MTWARGWRRSRAWRELGPYASLLPGLVVYGALRLVFAHVVGSGGFATPGSLDTRLAAFALMMLVMRTTILVGVPLVVTYRLVRRLFALAGARGGGAPTGEPVAAPAADSTRRDRAGAHVRETSRPGASASPVYQACS